MSKPTAEPTPDPQDHAAPTPGRSVAAALLDTLRLALPALAIMAVVEGVDGLLSNPQWVIPVSSRLLFLLALMSFYLIAGLGLALLQAAATAGLRRWLGGSRGWHEPFLLTRLEARFAQAPHAFATLLAGLATFLGVGFYVGYRLYRFTIDAQFELPAEAAAVMSWFHLVGLALTTALAAALGYGIARLALQLLSNRAAFRVLAALPLLVLAGLGYGLYTRVFARIVDMRWLAWVSFLLVFACVQGLILLLQSHREPGEAPRNPLHRLVRHRVARLVGLCLLAVGMSLGLHAFSELQLVRFQVFRFGRFAPHVATTFMSILDRDGDGHPALLGGLDCDDGDARRRPDGHDRPSDGHDDNCVAGDPKKPQILQRWLAQRTAGTFRHTATLPVGRQKFNVLLITIDACRPDHMSLYGYRRRTTPNLEVLGKNSLVFTQAYSQGNFTDLSLHSLLTGLYPSAFLKGDTIVPGRALAEYLKDFGYDTHAINDLREGRGFFARGFDRFDNSLSLRNRGALQNQTAVSSDADLTVLAQHFLNRRDQAKRPFFLWVHYSDPHGRYLEHKKFSFGKSELRRYDSEIAHTDHQISRLLNFARQRGLLKNTVIVVGADHGEAFGEHGFRTHGHSLYEEEVHVPLLIFVPTGRGGGHGRKITAPVENVDIVPTVLDLVGFGRKTSPMHGESLLGPAFQQTPLRSPGVFAESRHKGGNTKSLRLDRWKIIYNVRDSYFELYDLKADPKELTNLADARPRVLAAMKKALFQWMDLWLNGFKTYPAGTR